ncbi:hypothetical protein PBS_02740 [Paraburkholderia sp. 2C]
MTNAGTTTRMTARAAPATYEDGVCPTIDFACGTARVSRDKYSNQEEMG